MPRLNVDAVQDAAARAHLRAYVSADRYLTAVQDWLPEVLQQQQQQQWRQQPDDEQAGRPQLPPGGADGAAGAGAGAGAGAAAAGGQQPGAVVAAAHAAVIAQLAGRVPPLLSAAQLLHLGGSGGGGGGEEERLLPFGCAGLDALLLGGLRPGALTELAGETCAGKSQLCHLAAASAAGRGERVVYIDTTNAFSAARLRQLHAALVAPRRRLPQGQGERDAAAALANVSVVAVHSVHALLASLDELAHQLAAVPPAARPTLLVVDSASALLAPVIGGLQHSQGQVLVGEAARLLRHVAAQLRLAVLVTNHVVGARGADDAAAAAGGGAGGGGGGGGAAGGSRLGRGGIQLSFKPALGEQWRSAAQVRVQLSRATSAAAGGGDLVCATLLTHPLRAPGAVAWLHCGEAIADARPPP